MRQLASDIERSTPDPWEAVARTFHSPFSWKRTPRWNSLRPGRFFSGVTQGTRKRGSGETGATPESLSRASRTKA